MNDTERLVIDELVRKRSELIEEHVAHKGVRGYGRDATLAKISVLWGLTEETGFEHEEIRSPLGSSSYFRNSLVTLSVSPSGFWVWSFDVKLGMTSRIVAGTCPYGEGSALADVLWNAVPSTERDEALSEATTLALSELDTLEAAVAGTGAVPESMRFWTEKDFETVRRNIPLAREWLSSLLPERAAAATEGTGEPDAFDPDETPEDPLVDASGQSLLFPMSEGVPEEFTDERYERMSERLKMACGAKMDADAAKKHATSVAATMDRQAKYYGVSKAIEDARIESIRHSGLAFVAVDHLDAPRAVEIAEYRQLPLYESAVYSCWYGGVEIPLAEALGMPDPEGTEEDDVACLVSGAVEGGSDGNADRVPCGASERE